MADHVFTTSWNGRTEGLETNTSMSHINHIARSADMCHMSRIA
jgi:hypothetical protein